jgi:chromosome segregation ATPase
MHGTLTSLFLVALQVLMGCGRADNSAETDKAGRDLRSAEAQVTEHSKQVANREGAIVQTHRELAVAQDKLLEDTNQLGQQRAELGAATQNVLQARTAYGASIKERIAKLDASLSTLGTKADAKSKDAWVGLQARRDAIWARLKASASTPESNWDAYTTEVDATLGAIERDANAAL